MTINRRALFKTLLGGIAAAATLDPEKLLWVPGQKMISIPAPTPPLAFHKDAFQMVMEGPDDFRIGHIITIRIPPRYEVDPMTRQLTDQYQRFIISELRADGALRVTPIHPEK